MQEILHDPIQSVSEEAFVSVLPDRVSSSDDYAKRFAGAAGEWMLSVQTCAIDTLLAGVGEGTVLDVGGGHAQVTPHLMNQGRDVTALVSSGAAAERLNRITLGRAPYIVGNTELPTEPEDSYDIVIAMRMVAHVCDWDAFLAALCRMARKAVIVDFPVSGGLHRLYPLLFGLKKAIERDTRTYSRFTRAEVARAFARNGFVADGHVGQFVMPMVVHRFVQNAGLSRTAEAVLSPLAPRLGNPVIIRAQKRQ